ncbi:MAG: FISUMP domain-containing protein [Candidatus Nealsonbacteria bacterium]|nr:FISUMP domain-containing protein [Candidatus Nealsonbacteria bacterium]
MKKILFLIILPVLAIIFGFAQLVDAAVCGDPVNFIYKGSSVTYGTVESQGECWLDRNLGASAVATAFNDSNAYGDLFQWGRLDDQHQTRTSGTQTGLSGTDVPGHSNFIYGMSSPFDWRSPQNNNLWQGVSGINNPCPSGWRIPTVAELETERLSWSSNNYNGAYASPLKLTAGGFRDYSNGSLYGVGSGGGYWSSTVSGTYAGYLDFYSTAASMYSRNRAYGFSVRCVADIVVFVPTVTTQAASNIDTNSFTANGNITDTGGEDSTERGFAYTKEDLVSWQYAYDSGSFGTGAFSKNISGLDPGTNYVYRAYSTNSAGTGGDSLQYFTTASLSPCQSRNVSGWAWSENIGWVSFSCANTMAIGTGADYGVMINSNGSFSGYAWSENIGWIDFAPAGPYPVSPNYSACLDLPGSGQACDGIGNYNVGGWARALSYGGGWDGWIKLRGSNYGISINKSTGKFSGYAWSDMVIGWISFSGATYGAETSLAFNQPPNPPTRVPGVNPVWDNCVFAGKSLPTFSWVYTDPEDDPQTAYIFEIDDDASFQNPKFNHFAQSSSTSYTLTDLDQDDDNPRDWLPDDDWLDWRKSYHWQVSVRDANNNWATSNQFQFQTPSEAYPYSGFSWNPLSPRQGEVVILIPDNIEVDWSYSWTLIEGGIEFVDSTTFETPEPHVIFASSTNIMMLTVGKELLFCTSDEYVISAELPLPEYQEAPPIIWLKKLFASVAGLFE